MRPSRQLHTSHQWATAVCISWFALTGLFGSLGCGRQVAISGGSVEPGSPDSKNNPPASPRQPTGSPQQPQGLQASALASPISGDVPLAVQFHGSASGGTPPYTYAWSFGDGATASTASPTHTYHSPGTYTASLAVSDSAGNNAASPAVTITVNAPPPPPPPGSPGGNLVQFSDLQYLGAFRVPGGQNFDYGGNAMGFNPGNNGPGSLFITCYGGTIAEVSIPNPVNSTVVTDLSMASVLQSCADPTAGSSVGIGSGSSIIGGMLVYGGKLIISNYLFYDASASQTRAFFVKPNTNLSQANASGAYGLSNTPNIGFTDGWMAPIPSRWQAALKGPVAFGNNSLSIITRTSWGPDAFAADPAQFTDVNAMVPSTPLFYYTQQHPALGTWNDSTPVNNSTVWWDNTGSGYRAGGVIPHLTRSILFFGAQGMGGFCYGEGTSNPALDRQQVPNEPAGVIYCYDPVGGAKGTHGYPYQYQIMAFNLDDLASVAAGTKQPWDVKPYASWPLTAGYAGMDGKSNSQAGGAVYDPVLKRIYFSAPGTDTVRQFSSSPIIHVWQVNTAG